VNHVRNQSKQQTLSFIVCRCCAGLGLGKVFPNFLWPCTPKISYEKKVEENNKYIYQ